MKRKKGFYSISVVAKMFSVHQQTVRLYEKEGLITPKRSAGNTRLFSEEDVDRLEQIIYLTHKVGVNLAGVEIILKQQKKLKRLQEEMNKLFNQTQSQLDEETEEFKSEIKRNSTQLLEMKQKNAKKGADSGPIDTSAKTADDKGSTEESDDENPLGDWEIDYDE